MRIGLRGFTGLVVGFGFAGFGSFTGFARNGFNCCAVAVPGSEKPGGKSGCCGLGLSAEVALSVFSEPSEEPIGAGGIMNFGLTLPIQHLRVTIADNHFR